MVKKLEEEMTLPNEEEIILTETEEEELSDGKGEENE